MKWTLILLLGSFLVSTTLSWTYHPSGRKRMNWKEAREFCQKTYTDMVVIQSQEENDYLVSLLPTRSSSPYYWIGITKNHINETWTWVGNNSTWTGNDSWAENEPNNNHATEFCVEIYTNKDPKTRGKWNDEACSKPKLFVCYKAQCNATTCDRGTCWEAIEKTTCLCEPGFKGDRCQTAVQCPRLPQPDNGDLSCSGGNWTFNSTCQLKCHLGFQRLGSHSVTCGATGNWSAPTPICATVQCPRLPQPDNGDLSCSGGDWTFNSTCELKCHPGFQRLGSPSVTCGATGIWSAPTPICSTVQCPRLPQPDNGDLSCSGGNWTLNSTCELKCHLGSLRHGSPSITCGATGVWSGPRPICASYKKALLAVAGCGALSALCCICFCCMKRRKRKKVAQVRQPEEAVGPSSEAQG